LTAVPHRNLVLILFVLATAATFSACKQETAKTAAAGPPVVPVSVAKAAEEAVPTELKVVGNVDASSIVQVKSQVAGPIERVAFTEGQNVRKGDLLFVIDPRPFEEALRQAEAAVGRDQANIAQAEAALRRDAAQAKFAETDAARYAELQKAGVVSRSQYDQARTSADVSRESADATKASIGSYRAALNADVAAVAAARLNLSYCRIEAPISGRAGNLLVHAGNLVKVNDVPLVIIHQIEPVFVSFAVPEQHLGTIRRLSAGHKLAVAAHANDNPGRRAEGVLSVIDNTVDTTTGTIKLKATFDNRDAMLWPGQFVTVVLTLDKGVATVVPSEAVQNGQQGQFVYAVKPDNHVEIRPVTTGRVVEKKIVIEKGLAPGETVVIDGQLRLFPGAQIKTVDPAQVQMGRP
jgi:multidrug efflux system membrane fusion protein